MLPSSATFAARATTATYVASTMGLLTVLFVPQGTSTVEIGGSPPFIAAWLLLYSVTVASVFARRLRVAAADVLLFGIGLALVASAAWSARPLNTVAYAGAVTLNLILLAQVVHWMALDEFLLVVFRTIVGLAVVGSLLYVLRVPFAIYVDTHERLNFLGSLPLRGLFNHKISAAYYAAVAAVLAVVLYSGLARAAALGFLLLFVLLTGSATGVALLLCGILSVGFVRLCLRARVSPGAFLSLLLLGGLTVAVLATWALPAMLTILGRDPTLTGRTLLWAWGIQAGMQRPLLGWGYSGYLGSLEAEAASRGFRDYVGYDVPHFHNGYVQSFAELGLFGTALLLVLLLGGARAYYRLASLTRSRAYEAMVCLLLLVASAGVVMQTFFKYNEFTVLLLGIAALGVTGTGSWGRPEVRNEGQ